MKLEDRVACRRVGRALHDEACGKLGADGQSKPCMDEAGREAVLIRLKSFKCEGHWREALLAGCSPHMAAAVPDCLAATLRFRKNRRLRRNRMENH